MYRTSVWLLLLVFMAAAALLLEAQHPKPPGITTGDTLANAPLEKPTENRTKTVDLAAVKQEADELRKLADVLPDQVQQVSNNQLPKDLSDNLKRIEKLAKHLRGELTP